MQYINYKYYSPTIQASQLSIRCHKIPLYSDITAVNQMPSNPFIFKNHSCQSCHQNPFIFKHHSCQSCHQIPLFSRITPANHAIKSLYIQASQLPIRHATSLPSSLNTLPVLSVSKLHDGKSERYCQNSQIHHWE